MSHCRVLYNLYLCGCQHGACYSALQGTTRPHHSRCGLRHAGRHIVRTNPDARNTERFKGLYPRNIRWDSLRAASDRHRQLWPRSAEPSGCDLPQGNHHGVSATSADFSGSYNLLWTAEQVEMIIKLSAGNFGEGQDMIKQEEMAGLSALGIQFDFPRFSMYAESASSGCHLANHRHGMLLTMKSFGPLGRSIEREKRESSEQYTSSGTT